MRTETRKRLAYLTSNTLNPFLVCLVLTILLSFESTSGILDALKWSLILTAIGILPTLLAIIYLVRRGSLDGVFTSIRKQRTRIYALSGICAAAGYVILYYARAPLMLQVVFVSGIPAAVIFLVINLWWKISLHTAFVATLVTIMVLLYGWIAAVSVILVLIIGWARLELKEHSLAQVTAGALLAASIVVIVFQLFNLT